MLMVRSFFFPKHIIYPCFYFEPVPACQIHLLLFKLNLGEIHTLIYPGDLPEKTLSCVLLQGRCSSDSHSSEEAGGGGGGGGGSQTVVQSQVQGGSGQPCRALDAAIEVEAAMQEMEMQTHQAHMCSPHCSPGE